MRLDEIKSSQMKKQAYIRKMQMRDNPLNVWGDEWDADNVSSCHACGEPIDFNFDEDAECEKCDGIGQYDWTRGPSSGQTR